MNTTERQGEQTDNHEMVDVMTAEEVATFLRVNRKTIYEATANGEIPCQKVGRQLRFNRYALIALLNNQDHISFANGGNDERS